MIIETVSGKLLFVRIVNRGDRWGRDDCLVHDEDEPLVQFFLRTPEALLAHGPRGYMVSAYYCSTLAKHRDGTGLCLDGRAREYDLDAAALAPVIAVCREIVQ